MLSQKDDQLEVTENIFSSVADRALNKGGEDTKLKAVCAIVTRKRVCRLVATLMHPTSHPTSPAANVNRKTIQAKSVDAADVNSSDPPLFCMRISSCPGPRPLANSGLQAPGFELGVAARFGRQCRPLK